MLSHVRTIDSQHGDVLYEARFHNRARSDLSGVMVAAGIELDSGKIEWVAFASLVLPPAAGEFITVFGLEPHETNNSVPGRTSMT